MSIQNFRPIPTITVANDYWENKKWRFNVPEISVGAGATPQPIDVTVKGIDAVTLVNAIDDGLLSLTLFGGTEQLPEQYLDTVVLSGGCEQNGTPTPDNPIDIVCNNGVIKVTHNLIDLNAVTNGYYYESQGVYTASQPARLTDYIPVKAGVTYSVSTYVEVGRPTLRYNLFDNNKVWLSQTFINSATTGTTYVTQVTPTQDGFLRFSGNYTGNSYINWNTAKIVYGEYTVSTIDSAIGTIYVDGTQEVVTDSLGNTASAERLLAVGDYKDTQEVLSGSVTRNIGIKVLDGTEDWTKSSTTFYSTVWEGMEQDKDIVSFCTHYAGISTSTSLTYIDYPAIRCGWSDASNPARNRIYIKDESITSASDFKQYLAQQYANGTPVIIVYPLATATTESVSGQVLQKSPVTQTAGSISNLPIAITESSHTVPTPQQPLQINCNNGVVKVSKNLFDKTNGEYMNGYVAPANGKINTPTDAGQVCFVIPCLPNTIYTLSGMSAASTWGSFTAKTVGTTATNYTSSNGTLTTGANDIYLIGMAYTKNGAYDYRNTLQIELGSTPTPYHPYSPTGIYTDGTTETVEIDTTGDSATAENLFKVGTYQDVQSVIDGGVTRNVGIKVLDGTEGWEASYTSGIYFLRNVTSAILPNTCICTHFLGASTTSGSNMPDLSIRYGVTGYDSRLYIRYNSLANVNELKQYLSDQYNSGNPVVVVYPLATPTTETVTPQPMNIQAGTNIVQITQASMDDLELEVKYKAGVAVTITEIQNVNLDNNVEVTING